MPEGPEVKKVVDYLQTFSGLFLQDIGIVSGRYVRHGPFDGYYDLKQTMPLKILTVNCRGKFIYIYFVFVIIFLRKYLGDNIFFSGIVQNFF